MASTEVHEVVAAGYGEVSPGDLAKMHDHGLSGSSLRKASALSHRSI